MWTCIECEHEFINGISGDVDERMCHKCLNGEEQEDE